MKIKYITIIVFIIYIFSFPAIAKAEIVPMKYLDSCYVYEEMSEKDIYISDNKELAEKIYIIITDLFSENANYIPKGSKLISVEYVNNKLYLNFNNEIISYGGGSNYEIGLLRQILNNVFQFEEIKYLTIQIDNNLKYFPEGSFFHNYSRNDYLIQKSI